MKSNNLSSSAYYRMGHMYCVKVGLHLLDYKSVLICTVNIFFSCDTDINL